MVWQGCQKNVIRAEATILREMAYFCVAWRSNFVLAPWPSEKDRAFPGACIAPGAARASISSQRGRGQLLQVKILLFFDRNTDKIDVAVPKFTRRTIFLADIVAAVAAHAEAITR